MVQNPKKTVKNGVKRRETDGYLYTNEDLSRITGCMSIERFAERQQLRWLAHCIRMENISLQKTTLFMIPTKAYYRDIGTRIEEKLK